jgi:hypothetical protein
MWAIDSCDMHNVPNFNKNDKLKSKPNIENIKWKTKLHIQNHDSMICQIINDHTTMKSQKPNSLLINSYNLNGQTLICELYLTQIVF